MPASFLLTLYSIYFILIFCCVFSYCRLFFVHGQRIRLMIASAGCPWFKSRTESHWEVTILQCNNRSQWCSRYRILPFSMSPFGQMVDFPYIQLRVRSTLMRAARAHFFSCSYPPMQNVLVLSLQKGRLQCSKRRAATIIISFCQVH
jgi:hypothetical protein